MVSRVKDNNPLGTQKIVSLAFNEEYAREPPGKLQKNFYWSHLTNSRRRYMAEILPIRRNTIQSINQTINQAINKKNLYIGSEIFQYE